MHHIFTFLKNNMVDSMSHTLLNKKKKATRLGVCVWSCISMITWTYFLYKPCMLVQPSKPISLAFFIQLFF